MVKIGMERIWASLAGCTEKRLDLRDVIKEEAARFPLPPKGVRQEKEKYKKRKNPVHTFEHIF